MTSSNNQKFLARELARGVSAADAYSAHHKATRRHESELAYQCTALFHYRGYANALWGRIILIAAEDVGPADPWIVEPLLRLYTAWRNSLPERSRVSSSARSRRCALELFRAVRLELDAPKCRLNDTLLCVARSHAAHDRLDNRVVHECPPFEPECDAKHARVNNKLRSEHRDAQIRIVRRVASRRHTEAERMRGVACEWARLERVLGTDALSAAQCVLAFEHHMLPALLGGVELRTDDRRLAQDGCLKLWRVAREAYKTFPSPLWFYHTIVHCCRDSAPPPPATRTSFSSSLLVSVDQDEFWRTSVSRYFSRDGDTLPAGPWHQETRPVFPDWVYDKHTIRGKVDLCRSHEHFFDVGASLVQPPGTTCAFADYFHDEAKSISVDQGQHKRDDGDDGDGDDKNHQSSSSSTSKRRKV